MKRHFTGAPVAEGASDSGSSDEEAGELKETAAPVSNVAGFKDVLEAKVRGTDDHGEIKQSNQDEDEDEDEDEDQHEDQDQESSSDESSSEDEQPLLKPVFLTTHQRATKQTINKPSARENTLKAIEVQRLQEMEQLRQQDQQEKYGGLDDTDGLDPEREKAEWTLRQLQREKRDREKEERQMEELEELEMRRLRTEEQRTEEQGDEEQSKSAPGSRKKAGAFYREDDILGRNMEGEVETYDKKLLPQRYKPS